MYFTGVNIGGYLSQVKDNNFSEEHLNNFITEEDFKRIKGWGFNIIRMPVDYMLFDMKGAGDFDMKKIKHIDRVFDWAEKHGIYLVLDYHIVQGHTFSSKDRMKNDIWDSSSKNRARFLETWDFFSKRYKDKKNAAFEVMNEPVADKNEDWNKLAADALAVIRKNMKDNYVVVESNKWGMPVNFNDLTVFDDPKIIYSFHTYDPILVTHQLAPWVPFVRNNLYVKQVDYPGKAEGLGNTIKELENSPEAVFADFFRDQDKDYNKENMLESFRPVIEFRKKHDVPVLCGEFGCIVKAKPETRRNWLADAISIFKEHKISYTYWSYKNMDFGIYDYTELYADNPNYSKDERLDAETLRILRDGIL